MQRSSVDLPLPFGPSRPSERPGSSTWSTPAITTPAAVGVPDAAQLEARCGHESRDVERDRAEVQHGDGAVDAQERHVDAREVVGETSCCS